jgi:hypothetical protein
MNQKEEAAPTSAVPVAKAPSAIELKTVESPDFEGWLEHFYKECGREVTLAYTTLNQMKNWAVLIVAAVVSAVVAVQRTGLGQPQNDVAVYIGALIAYVFTLRFFVRAVLCYINLVRWNNLQRSIVAYKIAHPASDNAKTFEQLKHELLEKIDQLYFGWHAPPQLTRATQLLANLKLGFGLLLALPLFFAAVIGVRMLPFSFPVLGITVFAIGYTIVELLDFLYSRLFDTPEVYAKHKPRKENAIFPTPKLGTRYMVLSLINVLVSIVIGLWPEISMMARTIIGCTDASQH